MERTGDILNKYLKEKNISQIELAKKLDVTPQYINNILNNLKGPSNKFLEKFYTIFNVNEKDKEMIEDNENFKKIPEKYKLELKNLRESAEKNINYSQFSKVVLQGTLYEEGYLKDSEKLEEILFLKLDKESNKYFAIKIHNNDYEPIYHEEDLLIFENIDIINGEKLENDTFIYKYKGIVKIGKYEYVEKKLILKGIFSEKIENIVDEKNMFKFELLGKLIGEMKYIK